MALPVLLRELAKEVSERLNDAHFHLIHVLQVQVERRQKVRLGQSWPKDFGDLSGKTSNNDNNNNNTNNKQTNLSRCHYGSRSATTWITAHQHSCNSLQYLV